MDTVTKRELNQQTSKVLDEVQPGAPVIVTERGRARWRIEAVRTSSDPVARLAAEGRIIPAKKDPRPWTVAQRDPDPNRVDALLDELRGED